MKKLLLITLLALLPLFAVALPPASAAAATTTKETVCDAIGSGADCTDNNGGNLTDVIKMIISVLSIIIGIIAVIMIIFAGAKYITSGGDTNKITSAKNALIYAIIGLVIVALAQFLVQQVLKTTNQAVTPPTGMIVQQA